ncbi:hypothetical protein CBR_g31246 [Chara braunii]|uniref:RNA-directed DNA polymerase n=1 Tax=Chara braunii TaxID=69332 RepID=A0A388JXT1_CHABU|nr:hypothetical protein CBR_g31246 [Chara braunii]|eukprot:GBG62610.1 hypothetical protein CBR_g31246 [Chara braunii]
MKKFEHISQEESGTVPVQGAFWSDPMPDKQDLPLRAPHVLDSPPRKPCFVGYKKDAPKPEFKPHKSVAVNNFVVFRTPDENVAKGCTFWIGRVQKGDDNRICVKYWTPCGREHDLTKLYAGAWEKSWKVETETNDGWQDLDAVVWAWSSNKRSEMGMRIPKREALNAQLSLAVPDKTASSTPDMGSASDTSAEILGLDSSLAHVQDRVKWLEQRPVAAADASSSNTADRLNALEMRVGSLQDGAQLQHTATQQLQQRVCTTANTSSTEPRETTPKFDGQEIFCDSMKTDPIPWFRKFELTLQLSNVKEHKHHAYLYSRSGGACQAWLDNLLSKYGVVAADLHTKISWDNVKAAWHKQFRVEPPEIKAMDKLMVFEQGTLPSRLPGPQCAALSANLHTYLSFYAPPTSPTDDEVAVGDIVAYTTKVAREFHTQRCDDNNAPLMYVRIQVGQASCRALLDSGAACNFMSQFFMQRAGLGAQVRRKANRTAIKLADGKTQQLLDHYIEAVPVYFAPHACEPVTFDILDTDFDIILGMPWLASADHTVNFHRRTLSVRDAFGAEVACTISLPHSSIRCQVVTTKSFRAICAYEQPEKIGLCFLRTVAVADSSPTHLSSDPRVVRLLDEFVDIIESPTGVLPDRPISHEIVLKAGAEPPKGCIYRMSEEELEVLRAQLDDLLAKGWIRPSSSPYGAPNLLVRKKNKDLRLCIDYRKLNAQTVKNAGPLPRIDDLLERLGGAKYFSKLDLKSGYHQISIQPNDRYKTAFKTRYGHFEWVVMPFGLTNAPATFQAAMTNEFRAMLDRFVLVYLDDILVYSQSLEDNLGHLRRVLETLRRAKYKANRDKCEFVRQELEYLGHFVTPEGISPLSDKIQAVQEWLEPRNVTDVRSFLGLTGYYERFIKGYSKIAAHMNKLQSEDRLRRGVAGIILRSQSRAIVYGGLADIGPARAYTRHYGCYFSKKVPLVHSIDDARKKELLAFVHALKRWRHFLLGRSQFCWVMDNNPLVFYKTQDTVNSTIAQWMAFIDQFDFFPDHIPGKSNHFADALSRRPDHCTAVYSTFEIDDDLQNNFIHGYQADPEFRDKYANCSSPNPTPSHYRIQEGYLLVHTRGRDLLCVPSDPHLRTGLLGEFHDAPATGHFRVNRTIGRLRQRFWWPGVLGDLTRYCESCEVCRRCKSRNHRPYGELRPLPVPLQRREAIAMDITGPFPKNKTGVDGILTVVDQLTKFAMFLPCRYHAKAPELAEVLYAGWIRTKGYPKEIVCDRDTRFMSNFWLALIKRWGSSLKPSSARHPQTDGQTERAHQTAQVLLLTLIRPDQKDWVERLPDVELAYNSFIHPAIGISPFEFEHGSPVTSPLDTITPRTTESDDHVLFLRRMQELLVKARDQMAKTQQRTSQQANRQRLPCPFRAGDLVWVSVAEFSLEQDVSRKLLPKWMGPWPIIEPTGDAPEGPSFTIQVPSHVPVYPVFHCSKLALYTPADHDDFPGRRTQDPPSVDGFQEVGDIISQRHYGNKPTEYLVHFVYASKKGCCFAKILDNADGTASGQTGKFSLAAGTPNGSKWLLEEPGVPAVAIWCARRTPKATPKRVIHPGTRAMLIFSQCIAPTLTDVPKDRDTMGHPLLGALLFLVALFSEAFRLTESLEAPPAIPTQATACAQGTQLGDLSAVNASCKNPAPEAVCSECLAALMKTVAMVPTVKGDPMTAEIIGTCTQRIVEKGIINAEVAFMLTSCPVHSTNASCPVGSVSQLDEDAKDFLKAECNPNETDTPGFKFCDLCRPAFVFTLYSIPELDPSNPSMIISCVQTLAMSFPGTVEGLSDDQKRDILGCFNESFPGVPLSNVPTKFLPQRLLPVQPVQDDGTSMAGSKDIAISGAFSIVSAYCGLLVSLTSSLSSLFFLIVLTISFS